MAKFYTYQSELSGQWFVVEPAEDGSYMVHSASRPEYLAWLAEGNTPEPWEAPNGTV